MRCTEEQHRTNEQSNIQGVTTHNMYYSLWLTGVQAYHIDEKTQLLGSSLGSPPLAIHMLYGHRAPIYVRCRHNYMLINYPLSSSCDIMHRVKHCTTYHCTTVDG